MKCKRTIMAVSLSMMMVFSMAFVFSGENVNDVSAVTGTSLSDVERPTDEAKLSYNNIVKYGSLNDVITCYNSLPDSGDYTITLIRDIATGTIVTIDQGRSPVKNVILDGDGHVVDSNIKISGKSQDRKTCTITIQDVIFERSSGDCITAGWRSEGRYVDNLEVNRCTFNLSGDAVAISTYQCYGISIIGCVVNGGHSLLQAQSMSGDVLVDGCTVNSARGINIGNSTKNVTVTNTNITAVGKYGIRLTATGTQSVVITDCSILACDPIILRHYGVDDDYTVTFTGKGEIKSTVEGRPWFVAASGDYDENTEPPEENLKVEVIVDNNDLNTDMMHGAHSHIITCVVGYCDECGEDIPAGEHHYVVSNNGFWMECTGCGDSYAIIIEDEDDELPPIPGQTGSSNDLSKTDDDTTLYVACVAAAAVVAVLAILALTTNRN